MANEIDLYKDLDRAERFLKYCYRKKFKDSYKTARTTIEYIKEQIKEQYPDLAL